MMSFPLDDFIEFIEAQGFKHFKPSELLVKTNNIRNGVKNNPPPKELWPNIVETVHVLDELRRRLNKPIVLHSTYRSPRYNAAIKGAKASQHLRFCAIDFHVVGGTPKEASSELVKMRKEGVFSGGIGLYPTFVHVDTRGHNATW